MDSVTSGRPAQYQQSQMKKLAELIDQNWDIEYKRYLDAQIFDEKNETFLDVTTSSSFQQFLVQHAWLPPDGNHADVSKPLYCGRELFDRTRQIHCLFHSHVPYIGAQLNNEDFINRLHIKRNVNVDDVIKYLMKWSQQSCEDDIPFYTSIEHMYHVYVYLKQEVKDQPYSAVMSGSTGSQALIEKFQEEKLIFVPDKYLDNSTKDNVAGHFQTIHSVCWKDPSTVLYMRQKFSLPLAANLPQVLSLYYYIQEEQNQLQQAFAYFGVPEAPRVASYVTLLKYISTISPHPEAEHVADFTSIAFELVRLCNEVKSVSPDFIYNNLKNSKVFPTKRCTWVSLEICLLEDDDKNIAKCFQKSDDVSFILWPDVFSKKRSRNANRQQILANQEAKEEFVKICKISKLSAKASPRVDFGGEARPVENVKAQLSCWVVAVQRFIAASCEDLYMQLLQDGIQDKLHRLQVLSVISLNCRYFIDHNGSQIASPGTIDKGCEYCYDGNTSTIYIAADKIEKPGALLPALMKLFAQNASEEDSDMVKKFLEKLLLDCPTNKEELEELIIECDLQCLRDDETVWEIPLPKHQYAVEYNSTEEESDGISSDDELDSESVMESQHHEGEKSLTSWPPKAAVDPVTTAPRHIKQFSNAIGNKVHSQGMSSSMIGEDELREARKKYLQEHDESRQQLQPDHYVDNGKLLEYAAPPRSASSTLENLGDSSSLNIDSPSKDNMLRPSDKQMHEYGVMPSNAERIQKQKPGEFDSEYTSSMEDHDQSESKKRTNSHQYYPEDSKWIAAKRARVDSEVDLVDIQHFVQNIQGSDTSPLVKLLEDVSSNDEESQIKIGRWGEEYVYVVLKKMEQLPDGTKIQSVKWINENEETDKPYDIVVEVKSDGQAQVRCVYIEVKSTAAREKELVSISVNQLKFAEDHGEDFHLYRVYCAGRPHSRLCMLENLYNYIRCHHIRFFFEL